MMNYRICDWHIPDSFVFVYAIVVRVLHVVEYSYMRDNTTILFGEHFPQEGGLLHGMVMAAAFQ